MADFSITFLGTGTSQGVPVIACDCRVCVSADPRDKRTRSSIYVETPEAAFVVDTGTDFRTQALREDIRRMDAVLLTHSHADHVMGFDDLRAFCSPDRWIPVHASADTLEDVRRVFAFAFTNGTRIPGYIKPEPHVIDGPFSIGETTIAPLRLKHGRTTTLGFLFSRNGRKLAAYLSDCKEVPDAVIDEMQAVDTLIIDALRQKTHPTHLSIPEATEIARRVAPRQTFFTHICHDISHSETEPTLAPGIRLAHDGMRLDFA